MVNADGGQYALHFRPEPFIVPVQVGYDNNRMASGSMVQVERHARSFIGHLQNGPAKEHANLTGDTYFPYACFAVQHFN